MFLGPGNDIVEAIEVLIGKETWDLYVKELKLTPSRAGAGGKYNGQDLKIFLREENLEKLAALIPHGETITAYMRSIDMMHTMCVAKSVVPYDVWGICRRFRESFEAVYDLGIGLSNTTKIHICISHIPEWFMLEETGLETLYTADCSNFEGCHGAIKRIEQSRNLEIRTNRGSDRERRALESTLAHHNFSTDMIQDPRDQVPKVDTLEVTQELHTLALTSDSDPVSSGVAADVVIDNNGNVVFPTDPNGDHTYTSGVPLTNDKRSKQSLIKVISSK